MIRFLAPKAYLLNFRPGVGVTEGWEGRVESWRDVLRQGGGGEGGAQPWCDVFCVNIYPVGKIFGVACVVRSTDDFGFLFLYTIFHPELAERHAVLLQGNQEV